ncbi:MAG TPA: hypothetical protein VF091_02070 [Gaiellaceae bacterium]
MSAPPPLRKNRDFIILCYLPAGALIDRWNRKIAEVAFVDGCFGVFFRVSESAALPQVVPRPAFQEEHDRTETKLVADIVEGIRFLWRQTFLRTTLRRQPWVQRNVRPSVLIIGSLWLWSALTYALFFSREPLVLGAGYLTPGIGARATFLVLGVVFTVVAVAATSARVIRQAAGLEEMIPE